MPHANKSVGVYVIRRSQRLRVAMVMVLCQHRSGEFLNPSGFPIRAWSGINLSSVFVCMCSSAWGGSGGVVFLGRPGFGSGGFTPL